MTMQKIADDLIALPIEMKETAVDTKFRLVHIASQRVRQLSAGVPLQVATQSIKDTTIALEEAVAGKLKILTGEEAKKAKEEFRKQEERARIEGQLSAKEEEIRKELSAYLSETRAEDGDEDAVGDDISDKHVDAKSDAADDAEEIDEAEETEE
jgi:DNA-directed RNA polymerase omega subunit